MSNGEEEAGASSDFLKQFRLETKGCCFVCFGEIEGDARTGGDNSSSSVSLHKAFRHLQVDMGKVIEKLAGGTGGPNLPSSTYSTLLKQTEIIASLCNNCRTAEETLVELVEMEEKIRLEKLHCLEQIQGRFREPERNQRREQEYRQRMTSDIGSMLFLWIVEELRKEVAEKCQLLTSAGGRRVVSDSEKPSPSTSSASTGNKDQEQQNGRQQEDSTTESKPELKMETEEERNPGGNTDTKQFVTAGEIILVDISSEEEEGQQQTKTSVLPPPEPSASAPIPGPVLPTNDQTCPVCGDQFKFTIGLIKHMERTGHTQNQTVSSSLAPLSQKTNYTENIQATSITPSVHFPTNDPTGASGSIKSTIQDRDRESTPSKKFECERCHKTFSKRYNLTPHRLICTGANSGRTPSHKCGICGKLFLSAKNAQRHFANIHLHRVRKRFPCELCDKRFSFRSNLTTHRKLVHFPVKYLCEWPGCGKSFSRTYYLQLHKKKEHQGQSEPAPGSSSSFLIPPPPASSILSEEPFSVDLFPVTGSQAGKDPLQFLSHDPEVEGVDPSLPPPEGQKALTEKKNRPRARCDLCGQKDSSPRSLRVHQLSCNGSPRRPYGALLYECKICGKGFSHQRSMTKHRYQVHLRLQRFPCPFSGKEFKSKGGLEYHVGRVHNGITFQCGVPACGKRFKDKNYLKIHEKLKHWEGTSSPTDYEEAEAEAEGVHPDRLHFLEPFLGNGEDAQCPGEKMEGSASGIPSTPARARKRGGKLLRFSAPTCGVCGKRFSTERNVVRHMKSAHLGLRYECTADGCRKRYTDPGSLKRHLESKHSQSEME